MNGMVKNVFLLLMMLTLAWLLYLIFFGTYSLGGKSLVGDEAYTGGVAQMSEWKGLLWYICLSVEHPISRYYYQYCYLPGVHSGDYIDEALGGIRDNSYFEDGDIFKTETNLSGDSDMYRFHNGVEIKTYSTGWR